MKDDKFKDLIDWAKHNVDNHIIGILDENDGEYYLNICQNKDSDGLCGRYCHVSCTHYSRTKEVKEMNNQQSNEFNKKVWFREDNDND